MAKYIIDIPDEEETMWEGFNGDLFIPITMNKGTKTWVNTDLKMTPYTEPDRKAIEDEVWDFARRIICPSDCCEDSISRYIKEIFGKEGWETRGIFIEMTYQEAKAKYESWKAKRDELSQIHVGDEVEYECCGEVVKFIVTGVIGSTVYGFKSPCGYDDVGEYCDIEDLRKTGRHFDEAEELLKKMRKSNEN